MLSIRTVARLLVGAALVASTISWSPPSHAGQVQPGGLDHFKCYNPDPKQTKPTKRVPASIGLVDQFWSVQVTIAKKPSRLCNPVEKNHGGTVTPITNPPAHLVCHAVRLPTGVQFAPRDVVASNQFGDARLHVVKPTKLCLPAWKNSVSEFPPQPQPPGLDHFLCYAAAYSTAVQNPFEGLPSPLILRDQFEQVQANATAPVELCNPVEKHLPDGRVTPIQNPQAHLVCITITQNPAHVVQSVFIKHQFGRALVTTKKQSTLCAPSFKATVGDPG